MKERLLKLGSRLVRLGVPATLVSIALRPRSRHGERMAATGALLAFWSLVYRRYRRRSRAATAREKELLATATLEAFSLHYNERVPTIEEEFDLWGEYHQHRHEMRYDLVAQAVRDHTPEGGRILDVGCGSCLVADRVLDLDATYVGIDFGGHHVEYAAKKLADTDSSLATAVGRADGEQLPFHDQTFDVVVMSEVIEHLLRPEHAVWETARVLKPGGVFVMTTNNASEVPLYSPLSHLFAWVEKAVGADHPKMISRRPWVWPEPVDADLFPPGTPRIYLPHTHHIQAETREMFAAAGLDTFHWSTFEFPPPQAATARWLDERGQWGRQVVDAIEALCRRTPVVRRLGCHLFMLARKEAEPTAPSPPPGVWPGPFSDGVSRATPTPMKAGTP